MGSGSSSTAQVISKRVLETCAFQIPLQQILSSIDKIMQIKEDEVKERYNDEESAKVKKCYYGVSTSLQTNARHCPILNIFSVSCCTDI